MANGSPVVLTRRHARIIGALACCVSLTFAAGAMSPLFAEAQPPITSAAPVDPDAERVDKLLELARRRFGSLSDAEEALFRGAATGRTPQFNARSEEGDDPSNATNWPPARVCKAERIAWLCTDPRASELITHRGITIIGVRVDGELDLAYCRIPFPLCFLRCAFTEKITLNFAEIRMLWLRETHTKEIDASGLKVERGLFLGKIKVDGQLNLTVANIEGNLDCSEGVFINENSTALSLSGAKVGGSILLDNARTQGEVDLVVADIKGNLQCRKGVFINKNGIALSTNGAKVGGVIRLDNARTQGEIDLAGAVIGGDMGADDATFVNETGSALSADGVKVAGSVSFCGLNATGEVRLIGAKVDGVLLLDHATVRGIANLIGVTIGSDLSCHGSQFINKGGVALFADGMRVGGSVFLKDGFTATGQVNLVLASIGRNLDCSKGRFINPDGIALAASGARVEGAVLLVNGFDANGTVALNGATIGLSLMCTKGQMINTNKAGIALRAEGVKVGSDLVLGDGFKIQGTVNFFSAIVNHYFVLEKISSNSDVTLLLYAARVGTLCDDKSSWPAQGKLGLNGFVYDGIDTRSPKDAKTRIDWIKRQPREQFLPQPYEQLASVLLKAGYEEDEKEVLIAKNRDRAQRTKWYQPIRWWYWLLDQTIRYGYRPGRAFWASVIIICLGSTPFFLGNRAKLMMKTKEESSESYPEFNALLYSFETFVPLTKFQLAEYWLPKGGWLRLYLWAHSTVGLVLITLLVGALTGLIKI